ncbi:hypothetical protein [Prosthecobacter sp.]|uniref:hypothetical protein n=1 Tax=Prosthecobacter sp. TaxID=1965333 RepID=UPI002488654D|nr:hypothetical protein [Prosthecobacter sp.]MDI1313636.1 hypothetical protein [Prosthecobacter sp.]
MRAKLPKWGISYKTVRFFPNPFLADGFVVILRKINKCVDSHARSLFFGAMMSDNVPQSANANKPVPNLKEQVRTAIRWRQISSYTEEAYVLGHWRWASHFGK